MYLINSQESIVINISVIIIIIVLIYLYLNLYYSLGYIRYLFIILINDFSVIPNKKNISNIKTKYGLLGMLLYSMILVFVLCGILSVVIIALLFIEPEVYRSDSDSESESKFKGKQVMTESQTQTQSQEQAQAQAHSQSTTQPKELYPTEKSLGKRKAVNEYPSESEDSDSDVDSQYDRDMAEALNKSLNPNKYGESANVGLSDKDAYINKNPAKYIEDKLQYEVA